MVGGEHRFVLVSLICRDRAVLLGDVKELPSVGYCKVLRERESHGISIVGKEDGFGVTVGSDRDRLGFTEMLPRLIARFCHRIAVHLGRDALALVRRERRSQECRD